MLDVWMRVRLLVLGNSGSSCTLRFLLGIPLGVQNLLFKREEEFSFKRSSYDSIHYMEYSFYENSKEFYEELISIEVLQFRI
jgi:hypothetical protein